MENKEQSYTEFEKKLINILISFGKRKDILTVEICREMELKYGVILMGKIPKLARDI